MKLRKTNRLLTIGLCMLFSMLMFSNMVSATETNVSPQNIGTSNTEASDYIQQTLTDSATGVNVSGKIRPGAVLTIKVFFAHTGSEFGIGGCDKIAEFQAQKSNVIFLHNVDVFLPDDPSQYPYWDNLMIRIPTPGIVDGTVVTLVHCQNGDPDIRELTVKNGCVEFETNSLSQIALFGEKQIPSETTTNTSDNINYKLTVIDGEGGGWYQDGETVELKAVLPAEGAKFLRWELVEGLGNIIDPASSETEFTMDIGNATVKAVFELPDNETGISKSPKEKTDIQSKSPQTGDHSLPLALPFLIVSVGGMVLCRRHLLEKNNK